jgi:hypothetical protein
MSVVQVTSLLMVVVCPFFMYWWGWYSFISISLAICEWLSLMSCLQPLSLFICCLLALLECRQLVQHWPVSSTPLDFSVPCDLNNDDYRSADVRDFSYNWTASNCVTNLHRLSWQVDCCSTSDGNYSACQIRTKVQNLYYPWRLLPMRRVWRTYPSLRMTEFRDQLPGIAWYFSWDSENDMQSSDTYYLWYAL